MVTPLAGVWIEMSHTNAGGYAASSLPLRGCGLKLEMWNTHIQPILVTPLAGVWIEIIGRITKTGL